MTEPMKDDSDRLLLERAQGGDAAALDALLQKHQARIYRFGLKMCRNPDDAQDVLQETLLSMARGIRDFRGGSSISTWLYTIARSFCIKQRRRSKFAPKDERSLDGELAVEGRQLPDLQLAPDEALASKEVEQALERAIGTLPPLYREVLVLRDVEGLTAPEVAEVLGIGVDAVKSRLHRARLSVREAVAPLLGIPTETAAATPSTCPDVVMLLSQHLEDEISADLCAQMERHLDSCARCRGACDSLRRTLALCRTSAPNTVTVPASVQASVRTALRELLADKR